MQRIGPMETKLKLSAEATQEIGSVFTLFLYVILFVKKLHWPIVNNCLTSVTRAKLKDKMAFPA